MIWLEFVSMMTMVIMGSHGCLKCSREAMAFRNEFVNDYLEQKVQGDREFRKKLQSLLDNVIERLSNEPIHPKKYMGIIDEETMKKLTSTFKRSLNKIMENNFEVYCSNDCGRMLYIFINCHTCKENLYSCDKDLRCGERKVTVEEDEDLILDCALTWHKLSHGVKKYRFFRMLNGKRRIMAIGEKSFLTKKEANKNDAGLYRCEMADFKDNVESQLDFLVTVVPPREKTTSFTNPPEMLGTPPPVTTSHFTIPALLTPPPVDLLSDVTIGISSRAPPPEADWTAWKVSGITGGLLVVIVVAFLCYYRRQAAKEEEEDEEDEGDESDEEEDNDEGDSESSD